jgi:hypothetical protein
MQTKLKNKKKDVIVADINMQDNKTKTVSEVKVSTSDIIEGKKSDGNSENKQTNNESSNIIPNIKEIDSNENTKKSLNKIILNLQFLLSLCDKVDEKLLNIFSVFLSTEQFQSILEERDCRGLCGNMLCDRKIFSKNSGEKKYIYSTTPTNFLKENVNDFFCDVRCFQKFREVYEIAKKFDYFRLMHIDSISLFSILSDYYPENYYLTEIKLSAENILANNKNKLNLNVIKDKIKLKYDKYFFDDKSIIEVDKEDYGIEIKNIFEEKLNINK